MESLKDLIEDTRFKRIYKDIDAGSQIKSTGNENKDSISSWLIPIFGNKSNVSYLLLSVCLLVINF